METINMRVYKRNGDLEEIAFDKILNRIKKIGNEVNIQLNYSSLAMKVIDQLYDTIPTSKIDELTAQQCASLSTQNLDYGILASRIIISNHHKNTKSSFFDVMKQLFYFKTNHNIHYPLISNKLWEIISIDNNNEKIEQMIDYNRDYLIDYFGFKTLEKAYLFKVNKIIIERPQHMWMRVALGLHGSNFQRVKETN